MLRRKETYFLVSALQQFFPVVFQVFLSIRHVQQPTHSWWLSLPFRGCDIQQKLVVNQELVHLTGMVPKCFIFTAHFPKHGEIYRLKYHSVQLRLVCRDGFVSSLLKIIQDPVNGLGVSLLCQVLFCFFCFFCIFSVYFLCVLFNN